MTQDDIRKLLWEAGISLRVHVNTSPDCDTPLRETWEPNIQPYTLPWARARKSGGANATPSARIAWPRLTCRTLDPIVNSQSQAV